MVAKEHNPNGRESVLFDLGCGTGLNVSSFAEEYKTLGSDLSPEALSFCRKRNLKGLFSCSADAIALRNESVDVVTALDVLEQFGKTCPLYERSIVFSRPVAS